MFHRRATVFGGSGFIGRYVVQRLAAEGIVVRVAVRRPDRALFLKPLGAVGQIVPVATNIRSAESVRAAVANVDTVVNLVGVLHETGRQTFRAAHVEGAALVAAAAREAGVPRLVHMSALGADAGSESEYARSKAAGEVAVREAHPGATVIRPSIVIGPEDRFFNRFAQIARFSPILPLIGGGETRFQPVYVGDVANAIHTALHRPDAAGLTFELGGPRVYTFRELMELLLEEIGRRRILLPLPFWAATLQAWFLEKLPSPVLTRDQVRLLKQDNVLSGELPGFAELDLRPKAIETMLPTFLDRFRVGGRFVRKSVH